MIRPTLSGFNKRFKLDQSTVYQIVYHKARVLPLANVSEFSCQKKSPLK